VLEGAGALSFQFGNLGGHLTVIRRVTVILALPLCLLGAGCRGVDERERTIAGPGIDIEKDLKPGMAPEEVFKLLGKPDRDTVLANYEPPVIREINYDAVRLRLRFHTTKGLGHVEIEQRWSRAVYGYRYGDVLKPGEVDFETKSVLSHFNAEGWPDAYFCFDKVEVERDGPKQAVAKVKSIVLEDQEIYGSWLPIIRFK
jgi:hypothetical protein